VTEQSNEPTSPNDNSAGARRSELDTYEQRIAQLEAENAALTAARTTLAEPAPKAGRRHHRVLVAVLLVLGMLLTPVSILTLFVHSEIGDTGRYVQTVKPLSSNPAIQSYVADEITKELFARVDVNTYVKDALPEQAQVLAAPLTGALQSFVREATVRVMQTDQFQKLWVDANRVAHAELVNVLTGKDSGAISATSNGAVQIDLSAVTTLVSERLQTTGIDLFSKIPAAKVGGQITLFQSQDLYKVRKAVGILDTLAWVLPVLVFGCFGGAILLSRSRRRGFVLAAVAFTLGALVLALFLFVGRGLYLNAATNDGLPYDASAAVYDTLLRFLHTTARAIVAFSIVVLITVFFAGPSRLAVWFRSRVRWTANWLGSESERAGWHWLAPKPFVVRRKASLRIITAAVAFIVLFLWQHPTPLTIAGFAIVTLAVLAIVEFFGRQPTTDPPADPPTPRELQHVGAG
jgi:hypothetical protein